MTPSRLTRLNRWLGSLVLILFCCALAQAQRLSEFEYLTVKDGLSQSSVNDILADHRGFIWFATNDGLNRFDGDKFTVFKYDPADANSIPNSMITRLLEDRDGDIWALTNGAGVICYHAVTNSFTIYHHSSKPNSLSSDHGFSLYLDRQGQVWIGTENGLNRFDRQQNGFHFIPLPLEQTDIANNPIRALCQDQTGLFWLATDQGLKSFDQSRQSFTSYRNNPQDADSISAGDVSSLFSDAGGRLWVGFTKQGLDQYDRAHNRFIHYQHDAQDPDSLSDNWVTSITADRQGRLWVGTHDGLDLLDTERGKFSHSRLAATAANSDFNNIITVILIDRREIVWIGTQFGIGKYDPHRWKFTPYRHDPAVATAFTNDYIYAICQDQTGGVWLGLNRGLQKFDEQSETFRPYRTDSPALNRQFNEIKNISAILIDHTGLFWIGTREQGLYKYDRAGGSLTHFSDDSKSSADCFKDSGKIINCIYEDRAGTIWVGSFTGLCRYDRARDSFTVCHQDNFFEVRTIYQDSEDNLWLGMGFQGLVKFDRQTNAYQVYQRNPAEFNNPNNPSLNRINSICQDEQHYLWLGTYGGGLNRFDPRAGTFTLITEKDGLPSNVVYGIVKDETGHLWMSTNNGIASFDPVARRFRRYGVEDGLQSNEFNKGVYFRGRDGRLFFGGVNGFNMFYPTEIRDNPYHPSVFITNLLINNETQADSIFAETAASAPLILPYARNSLSVSFVALNYTQSQKNQYAYWLEGAEKDWRYLGTQREVRFANLAPGAYLLHLRGSNNDAVWSAREATFRFTIEPPLWQTWWAYGGYITLLLTAGFGVQRYRLKRLSRQNQLLAEKVRMRTSELDEKIAELKLVNQEREEKNRELAEKNSLLNFKNEELADKNCELIESQKQTAVIFSALSETLPGSILNDKYRLEDKIGSGGFGIVYRGVHLALNRPVAIKILQPLTGLGDENFERFHLEAISTCRVNHANTVAVLDFGITPNGIAYLVMELLSGHTLKDEIARQPLFSPQRCAEILIPVCECLATAHENGIIHRDIKPENIFLHQADNQEVIKLLDFGIAKLITRSATMNLHNVTLTQTGDFLGTPTYMAPERLANKPYDGRADVYSVGIILYHMLCGELPFESLDGSILSLAMMHMTQPPTPPRELRASLPVALEALLLRILSKDPTDRPTAEALAQQLAEHSFVSEGAEI